MFLSYMMLVPMLVDRLLHTTGLLLHFRVPTKPLSLSTNNLRLRLSRLSGFQHL
jgi:hypothetical protein